MSGQPVPLRAVGGKLWQVVNAFPELLNFNCTLADGRGGTGFLFEIMSGGEVVGMRMGVQDPLDRQALLADIVEDRVGIDGRRRSGLLGTTEYRIARKTDV